MRKAGTLFFSGVILFCSQTLFAQMGFGCLGFVGGYGGYSYQKYNPAGLNEYIRAFNEARGDNLSSPMKSFGTAKGYRVGVNLFRANIEGFILTTKGFYQSLTEKQSSIQTTENGEISTEFDLDIRNWAVGIDLGASVTKALSWKVVDAAILYSSANFKDTKNFPDAITSVNNYESESYSFGYSVGTGFILEIVDEYISLEGLAGYTVLKIDKVNSEDGYLTKNEFSQEPIQNFIEAGGFNAVIQLNIGFPL